MESRVVPTRMIMGEALLPECDVTGTYDVPLQKLYILMTVCCFPNSVLLYLQNRLMNVQDSYIYVMI